MYKHRFKHYIKHYYLKYYFFSVYERRFYNILHDILKKYNGKYRIFSKVRLWDLVDVPKDDVEKTKYQNKIARKHVDYVIVDKENWYKPVLAIELNGDSHNTKKAKERDEFVANTLEDVNLQVLFILNKDIKRKEYIRDWVVGLLESN